jgi:hypothetical protein
MTIDRRDFLYGSLAFVGAGLGLGLLGSTTGCSDDTEPPPASDTGSTDKGMADQGMTDTGMTDQGMADKSMAEQGMIEQGMADGAAQSSCVTTGTSVAIGANHGHALTVPKADVAAGAQKTYDIKGSGSHPHTVVVTTADFTLLQAGTQVKKQSSTDASHAHDVTITCA